MNGHGRTFALGALLVLATLGTVTAALFDLDARERAAAGTARAEQCIGQALLRMDLALQPLLVAEATRWPAAGAPLMPSPAPFLREVFAIADDSDDGAVNQSGAQLPLDLLRSLPPIAVEVETTSVPTQGVDPQSYAGRAQIAQNLANSVAPPLSGRVQVGAFTAMFAPTPTGDRLFFVRRPIGARHIQVIEADWPAMQRWLLDQVVDLLPHARLLPAAGDASTRRLVSLPAELDPGRLPTAELPPSRTLWLVIGAWCIVLAALGATGLAMRAARELGERRALFVSSVTHELRTPLTTFRMYSQMLAGGMVPDGSRDDYLATLKTESERLSRIVESVLLYARLEDNRGGAHRVVVGAGDLLERVVPLLRRRCADAGTKLEVAIDLPATARLHVDPQAVEQILGNLVDNALKHAPGTAVALRTALADGELHVDVVDRGPGIDARERKAIFRPFHRGTRQQAQATPGLGLGLAIAHGLAAALGGGLELAETAATGTTFRLRLPLLPAP